MTRRAPAARRLQTWLQKFIGKQRVAARPLPRRIRLERLEPRMVLSGLPPAIFGTSATINEGDPPFFIQGEAWDPDGTVVEVIYSLDDTFGDPDDLVFNNDPGNPNQLEPHPFLPGWYLAYGSFSWETLNAYGIVNDGPATYTLYVRVEDNLGNRTTEESTLEIINESPTIDEFSLTPDTSSCGSLAVQLAATLNDPGPLDELSYLIDWGDDPDFSIFDPPIPAGPRSTEDGSVSLNLTHTYAAPGTYTVTLYVFDDEDWLVDWTETVTVTGGGGGGPPPGLSVAPLFSVNEGQSVLLSATVSGLPGQQIALNWDLVSSVTSGLEPSATVTLDSSGSATWSVTVPWSTLVSLGIADSHGGGTYPITLYGADLGACGGSASVASSLKVLNVAPTVTFVAVDQPNSGGPQVTINGMFTDPGIGDDPFTIVVTWDTGVTQTVPMVLVAGFYTFSASHTYATTGTKTISVSVTDDEGATGSGTSASFAVHAALSDDGTLSVQGSAGDNNITISRPGGSLVRVQGDILGSPVEFPLSAVTRVIADLGAGDDWLLIAPTLTMPVVVFGGSGDDWVLGGGGPTVFAGGDGNDRLFGGGGRNILIGGNGADFLYGGFNEDILVGGRTIHDNNAAALLALLAEWNSSHTLLDRIRNLINGSGTVPGLNGSYFLTLDGEDGARDNLLGGPGTDWLLVQLGDRVVGLGDVINEP